LRNNTGVAVVAIGLRANVGAVGKMIRVIADECWSISAFAAAVLAAPHRRACERREKDYE